MYPVLLVALVAVAFTLCGPAAAAPDEPERFDVVIVGGTPGGIMAAIAAARGGHSALLLERTAHVGGLPANGLGATDIGTRGATGGLFLEFVQRVRRHYVETYGAGSPQVKDCSDGYHFEPSVAERIFEQMLAEQRDRVTVRRQRQFDARPENVVVKDGTLTEITILNREIGARERCQARVFIDATYEGDLAAAAGVPFRLGRESQKEFNEPMAGRLYKAWGGEVGPGSTGEGDDTIQSYNFRLCLTRNPDRVPIPRPATYNRAEYVSLIDDVKLSRWPGAKERREMAFDGIGRVVNMVLLPNGKTDANNQHAAFLSTDLPEENWPWPTADWAWRDKFSQRLRDYILGLLYFAQNDPELPEEFRKRCLAWGLSKGEYADNANFPRQAYVREGRRILGEHLFTAHDALPTEAGARPPLYKESITASHYSLDSHAVRKREAGRVHLDGFFSYPTRPYTVPYGVIVPQKVDGLLIPVPVSGTHIGFSTLRMEPCWMALGQAAGVAASLSIEQNVPPRKVDVARMQERLLKQGAVLIHFQDAKPGDAHYEALQTLALRGVLGPKDWQARLSEPVTEDVAAKWIAACGGKRPEGLTPKTTRGELLSMLAK